MSYAMKLLVLLALALIATTLVACGGTSKKGEAGFQLRVSPSTAVIHRGASESQALIVNITPAGGSVGSVILSLEGVPDGVTADFSTNPATTESILTLSAASNTHPGNTTITIHGVSDSARHSVELELQVTDDEPQPEVSTFSLEQYDPTRTGEIRTLTVGDFSLTYEEIDGLAILQGDMILGTAEEIAALAEAEEVQITPQGAGIPARVCWIFAFIRDCDSYRWPNKVVPYEIRTTSWGEQSVSMISRINRAIEHWEDETGIDFVHRTGQEDYVVFKNGSGCSSFVGRQGGKQYIHLAVGCSTGSVIHEVGHAVGLIHEQSRNDRNSFVDILWDNIISDRRHNFERSPDTFDGGAYDFGSIMHYPPAGFGIRDQFNPATGANDLPRQTIRAKDGRTNFGQRAGLSAGDIATVYLMYPDAPPTINIFSPTDGTSVSAGSAVRLEATANDGEDGVLPVSWISNLDGSLTTNPVSGAFTRYDLSPGVHTLTASATDSANNTVRASVTLAVTNEPPTVRIRIPGNGTTLFVSDSITLIGTSHDPNSRLPDSRLSEDQVSWQVDSFTESTHNATISPGTLTPGTYRVTFTGSDGEFTATDIVTITIVADPVDNSRPRAIIDSPLSGSVFFADQYDAGSGGYFAVVPLRGHGDDSEDGALDGRNIAWTATNMTTGAVTQLCYPLRSDLVTISCGTLDAKLYLSDNASTTYILTLEVWDSEGARDTETITVRVDYYLQ